MNRPRQPNGRWVRLLTPRPCAICHAIIERPSKAGQQTCSKRCGGILTARRFTKAQWQARGKAIEARTTKAQQRAWGAKGGRSTDTGLWGSLIERWMQKSPREALRMAVGYGYRKGLRAQRRAKAEVA